jgi:hypothetical protein
MQNLYDFSVFRILINHPDFTQKEHLALYTTVNMTVSSALLT